MCKVPSSLQQNLIGEHFISFLTSGLGYLVHFIAIRLLESDDTVSLNYRLVHGIVIEYRILEGQATRFYELASKVWMTVSGRLYSHPPVAFLIATVKGWLDATQQLIGYVVKDRQFQQLVDSLLLSRLDIYTATALRLLEAGGSFSTFFLLILTHIKWKVSRGFFTLIFTE